MSKCTSGWFLFLFFFSPSVQVAEKSILSLPSVTHWSNNIKETCLNGMFCHLFFRSLFVERLKVAAAWTPTQTRRHFSPMRRTSSEWRSAATAGSDSRLSWGQYKQLQWSWCLFCINVAPVQAKRTLRGANVELDSWLSSEACVTVLSGPR